MNKYSNFTIGKIEYIALKNLIALDNYITLKKLQEIMIKEIPRIKHFSQIRELLRGLLHKKIIEIKEGIFKGKIEDYSLKLLIENNHSIRIKSSAKSLIPILTNYFEK